MQYLIETRRSSKHVHETVNNGYAGSNSEQFSLAVGMDSTSKANFIQFLQRFVYDWSVDLQSVMWFSPRKIQRQVKAQFTVDLP